jgi:cytochrome b
MNPTTDESAPAAVPVDDTVVVQVWDWPVRLFHWSIVVLVTAAFITANIGGNAMVWHMRAGSAVLALVLFRVTWGFVGSRHARFASFLRGLRPVVDYLRSTARGRHPVSIGHNPLGGWSVIALLTALLIQATTGLFANDDIMTDGPLVKFITKDLSDAFTRYHYFNVWALGGLVGLHVAAVGFHLLVVKENLIRPMVHGKKRLHRSLAAQHVDKVPHVRAVVLLAASVFAVWWTVSRL